MLKELSFRLLAVILSFALVFGVGELLYRLVSQQARADRAIEAQAARARADSIWTAADDPVLIYRHRRDFRRDGVRLTNGDGILRATEVAVPKPPGTFRVAVFGDSIAAGLDLAPADRFPDRLERRLAAARRDAGGRVEVLNFAVNGYRTAQQARLVELQAPRFEPDLIVVQYCLNDPGNSMTPTIWFLDRPRPRSYLLRRLGRLFAAGGEDPRTSSFVPVFGPDYGAVSYWLRLYAPESASWRSVVDGLREIGATARRLEAPAILVVFPLFLADDWQRPAVAPFHRQVAAAATDAGLEVVDLAEVFAAHPVADLRLAEGDIYHPNARGHRLAADALYRRLAPSLVPAPGAGGTAAGDE